MCSVPVCRCARLHTVTKEKVTEEEERRVGGRAEEVLGWGRVCEDVLV